MPRATAQDSNMGGGKKDGAPTLSRLNALYKKFGSPRPPVVVMTGCEPNTSQTPCAPPL